MAVGKRRLVSLPYLGVRVSDRKRGVAPTTFFPITFCSRLVHYRTRTGSKRKENFRWRNKGRGADRSGKDGVLQDAIGLE